MDVRTLSQMEVHPDLYRPNPKFVHRVRAVVRNVGVVLSPDPTVDGDRFYWLTRSGNELVVHSAVYNAVWKGWE